FLGDRPAEAGREADAMEAPDHQFQALVGSVLHLEQTAPDYGEVRRQLRVIKMRGVPHDGGYHNFSIHPGRLEVFPRLAGLQQPEYKNFQRLASGLKDLDELLGGGLEQGTACLLVGPSGAGKSTLAALFALAVARRGDNAAIFLFEERPETFKVRSAGVGQDLQPA